MFSTKVYAPIIGEKRDGNPEQIYCAKKSTFCTHKLTRRITRNSCQKRDVLPDPKQTHIYQLKVSLQGVSPFQTYIANNQGFNPNYGERYRQGDRINKGFVESTVNYVVAKRFTKRQQMQRSPKGAHLTLQISTRVLNGELEQAIWDWHPGFGRGVMKNLKSRPCLPWF